MPSHSVIFLLTEDDAYIKIISFNIRELYRHRALARICVVHVADTMGSQVNLSILQIWYLVRS